MKYSKLFSLRKRKFMWSIYVLMGYKHQFTFEQYCKYVYDLYSELQLLGA